MKLTKGDKITNDQDKNVMDNMKMIKMIWPELKLND
jgi:hypothetical protein